MLRTRVWFFLAATIATATLSSQAVENNARMAAELSITAAEVKDHVGTLADDTFEGRESGTRGNRAAGIYITERLKKFGLRGGGLRCSGSAEPQPACDAGGTDGGRSYHLSAADRGRLVLVVVLASHGRLLFLGGWLACWIAR